MTTDSFRVVVDSPRRTGEVAAALAGHLRAGDVVLLHGELAAGKTTFVQAVAAALGSPDQVTSPTFMLAQFYAGGRVPVLHIDTYRLTSVTEFRDLGLDEHFAESVTLVEWGGLVADELPEHLAVTLELDPDDRERRTIVLAGRGARWAGVPEKVLTGC
ncbi:MAG: TsaE protein, required for threonylcarbamoyladenosine t(6)A37 formation in tRNA [uncultured Corynebacteriales bacterium]|uniref:tRNA threonylcarbamoyladenosine biosynthesis protein TsaE n=1 Tax=uncultured Mycobacteriales bacterium TaxID=581187 RepID=A0A6J4J0K6_9ACTN|nr:MAG: TsaE protein, required for threonylcarbamoyladenosine t(6)A37 formation in tRNA [uncultured Corynebacteriales bacterium]